MRYSLLLFLAGTLAAQDQSASFGVKAGVPVTSPVPYADLNEHTGRWTAGVTAEFHLISGLSAEVDALARSYSFSLPAFSSSNSHRQEANAWDFPLLLKYRSVEGAVRPFVNLGYQLSYESFDASTLSGREKTSATGTGPVGGIGVEFKYRRIRIAPEAHYTHLYHSGLSGSNGNLLTLLVGLTF